MAWNDLDNVAGINTIVDASHASRQLIFKHSTRCGVSSGAKMRLEGGLEELASHFDLHFLDLLSHRDVSNQIAQQLGVHHESPQVIVLDKGEVVFHTSHGMISPSYIIDKAATA